MYKYIRQINHSAFLHLYSGREVKYEAGVRVQVPS